MKKLQVMLVDKEYHKNKVKHVLYFVVNEIEEDDNRRTGIYLHDIVSIKEEDSNNYYNLSGLNTICYKKDIEEVKKKMITKHLEELEEEKERYDKRVILTINLINEENYNI